MPSETRRGAHPGALRFFVEGIPIARIDFVLRVGARSDGARAVLSTRGQPIQSAFASYARADTDEVIARIQGIKKGLPDLDVFLDVMSLRAGERW